MRVTVTSSPSATSSSKALLCLRWSDATRAAPRDDLVETWLGDSGFRGSPGEVAAFPTWGRLPHERIIVSGLGRRADFHPGVLRRAAAAAGKHCAAAGIPRAALQLDLPFDHLNLDPAEAVRLAVMGFREGTYAFRLFRTNHRRRAEPAALVVVLPSRQHMAAARRAARDALVVAEAINRTRDLANLPGNEAPPAVIARYARQMARRNGLMCHIWDVRHLRRLGCNAHLAVGQGSRHPPCLIAIRYPGRDRKRAPVVLVGKTITFDTGGISIKPARNMEWMRYDKCGGMTVLAVLEMAARLRLPQPLVGLLAVAENMPGSGATRPGDVVRSRAGKTIEIVNTDAEGRLVLADALSVAQTFKPSCIIDLATLTGAASVAVGHVVSAILGNHQRLIGDLIESGWRTGDRLWPLPLYPEYNALIQSAFADLRNIGDGSAGTIVGGAFLRHFVPDRIPWAHVDLTTAWEEREQSHTAAGATLFGAALLVDWLSRDKSPP